MWSLHYHSFTVTGFPMGQLRTPRECECVRERHTQEQDRERTSENQVEAVWPFLSRLEVTVYFSAFYSWNKSQGLSRFKERVLEEHVELQMWCNAWKIQSATVILKKWRSVYGTVLDWSWEKYMYLDWNFCSKGYYWVSWQTLNALREGFMGALYCNFAISLK